MAGKAKRLDIDQDLGFERRQWVVERVGWGLMAAIVVGGLLGVFGHGPISWTTVRDGPLAVEYDRFSRFGGETQLQVTVEAAGGGQVDVGVGREFFEAMEVSAVTPEPAEIRSTGDVLVYSFEVAQQVEDITVVFQLRPEALGTVPGRIHLGDAAEIRFSQFIYP